MQDRAKIQARLQQMVDEEPLGKSAHSLLRHAAVFRGTFHPLALRAITKVRNAKTHQTHFDALVILRKWGFVHASNDRCYLDYATIMLLKPYGDAVSTHCEYYFGLVRSASLNSIQVNWANICAALVWGLEKRPRASFQVLAAMRARMGDAIHHERWSLVLTTMLALVQRLEVPLEAANTQKMLGILACLREDYEEAQEAYARTIPIYQTLREIYKQSETLQVMGEFARQANDLIKARQHYEQAWMINPNVRTMETLKNLASAQNDLFGLLAYLRDELDLIRRHILRSSQADVFCQIGDILQGMGQLKMAWQFYKRALHFTERSRTQRDQIQPRIKLGMMAASLKAYTIACDMFAHAAIISEIDNEDTLEHREDVLWAWGLAEYGFNHPSSGHALCCIAILIAEKRLDTLSSDTLDVGMAKLMVMREQLKRLGGV